MRKFIFALIVFILAFAVPVTVYTLITGPSEEFDSRGEAAGNDEEPSNVSIPQIISVPVTEVMVGELYSYRVRAIDDDGDRLDFEARLYPSWMSWDEDLKVLEGTPGQGDIGLHRVELVVTDGKWVQTHAFDVSVADASGESVVPVSDSVTVGAAVSESGQGTSDDQSGSDAAAVQGASDISPSVAREERDPAEYGLVPVGEMDPGLAASAAQGSVLGVSTLPNTATFNGVVALSFGVAIMAMGIFIWSDAQWNISGSFLTFLRFERGEQVGMDVKSGTKVKKRKIRL